MTAGIPGLIDSHVHVGNSAALDEEAIEAHRELCAKYRAQVPHVYLALGFTTVVDLSLLFAGRDPGKRQGVRAIAGARVDRSWKASGSAPIEQKSAGNNFRL